MYGTLETARTHARIHTRATAIKCLKPLSLLAFTFTSLAFLPQNEVFICFVGFS